ncbi:MAG: hypothetical protein WD273_09650 [Trueperaceae bacterium]
MSDKTIVAPDLDKGTAAFPVIEMYSIITIDVARRREQGETKVLERVFLPKWKEGGVKAAFVTGDSPPQCPLGKEFPLENALFLTQAMLQDIAESDGRVVIGYSAVFGR